MASAFNKTWVGVIALVIAVPLGTMLVFEIKDGQLYGSESSGLTLTAHPVVFFAGVVIQAIILLLLAFAGVSIMRNSKESQ